MINPAWDDRRREHYFLMSVVSTLTILIDFTQVHDSIVAVPIVPEPIGRDQDAVFITAVVIRLFWSPVVKGHRSGTVDPLEVALRADVVEA